MERREFTALVLAAGLMADVDTEAAYRLRHALAAGLAALQRGAGLSLDILPWTSVAAAHLRGDRL